MTELCQGPDPHPWQPRLKAPPGATDSHFHILGPATRYPYVEDREYTPPDALPTACRRLLDTPASRVQFLYSRAYMGLTTAAWWSRRPSLEYLHAWSWLFHLVHPTRNLHGCITQARAASGLYSLMWVAYRLQIWSDFPTASRILAGTFNFCYGHSTSLSSATTCKAAS